MRDLWARDDGVASQARSGDQQNEYSRAGISCDKGAGLVRQVVAAALQVSVVPGWLPVGVALRVRQHSNG